MLEQLTKTCLICGRPLKGRSDKKFCNDFCRNSFNNSQKFKESHNDVVKIINSALARNRRVLESLLPNGDELAKARKEKMLAMGFQFKYLTHTYVTRTGKVYSYCYDYGYLPIGNDWFLVVKKKGE